MLELLWLLLPVAAVSGWFAALRESKRKANRLTGISSEYIRGLNYLLNEQPDKAIEVFIKMVEVDADTVETHLALGHLFRRRGETDRAIRIHQNLLARPRLESEIRTMALLELGEDYMKAGLFDRAENLFLELIDLNEHTARALMHLRDIYQQEQDWDKAIDICRQLEKVTGKSMRAVIAHYYCEKAEKCYRGNEFKQAEQLVQQALQQDKNCVRASIIQARIDSRNSNYRAAISSYRHVMEQDPDYFPEVIDPLLDCSRRTGEEKELMAFLRDIVSRDNSISPMLALAGLIREHEGEQEAMAFVETQLHKRPSVRGLNWLIELSLRHSEGEARKNLTIFYELTSKLLANKPVYECGTCGFSGKTMHWQCPGCKSWSSIKPIHGLEGE